MPGSVERLRSKRALRALVGGALVGAVALGAVAPAGAASGVACQFNGSIGYLPALTAVPTGRKATLSGTLSGCTSDAQVPATASVSAGNVWTDPATGFKWQELLSGGDGSCAAHRTSGYAFVRWLDESITIVSYLTTGGGAAVSLAGFPVGSIVLPAVDRQPGQPATLTVSTTRSAGSNAAAALAGTSLDPAACAGSGLASLAVTGALALGSA